MNFTNNRTVDGAATIQQGPMVPPAFHPQIVRSVRMHPMLAAAVGGFVFLALLGYGLTRKPSYKAESLVFEEPAAAKLLSDGTTGTFDPTRYDSYLEQQKQIMVRADVLRAAISTLPEGVWRELGPNQEAAVASLQAQLKADRVKTSYQLSIDLTLSDPVAAAAIVNAVTKAYLDAVHKESAAQSDQRALLLAEERSRIEAELDTTRREQAGLSASLGVASPVGETANPYDFEIAAVRQQLLSAREAHDVAAAQLNSISGETALTNAADEAILGDPALASLRATVSSRRATLNEQMAGLKPENPVYKQDLDELADLDKTVEGVTHQSRAKAEHQLQEKLRTDLERTGDIEARMNAQLARLTATATTAAPKLQRATELAEDLTRLNIRYAAVDDALRSLQLEANGPGVVRLSVAAAVPTAPEPSRKMLLLAAAPVFGALFGIAAAVFARKRDRRVYSPRDVEEILGFAPMAVLPAKDDVSPRVMEEYVLRLAAGIEGAYRGNGAQTFLLTAASASMDIRPLRKALTAKLERIGLDISVASTTDLLLDDSGFRHDAGHQMARPGDGAGFVSAHLAKLKGAHALVIINAPPLGTSAETEYVARCADATILIAESGVTTHEELYESARLLQRLDARGVGAVLQGLQLRLAGDAFRHAVDAVEQRQPDLYNSTVRSRPMVVEQEVTEQEVTKHEEDAPEIEYVTPLQRPAATPQAEPVVYPYGWAPGRTEEPVIEDEVAPAQVVEAAAMTMPVFAEEVTEKITEPAHGAEVHHLEPLVEDELPQVTPDPPKLGLVEPSHEKMTPKLSGPRETSSDGERPMSASRNWFQRLLHRDDEKVSILPDGDDDEPTDEASYLTSRISRAVPVYEASAQSEKPKGTPEPVGNRFVLEDLKPIEPEIQSAKVEAIEVHAPEVHSEPVAAEEVVESLDLPPTSLPEVAPILIAAPVVATPVIAAPEPAVAIADMPEAIEDLSATRLLARIKPRPARPLSFHQLVARAEQGNADVVPQAAAFKHVASEPFMSEPSVAEADAEMVHAVELPHELPVTQQESLHEAQPVIEEPSAETSAPEVLSEETVAAAPVMEQPTVEEPVAVAVEPESTEEEQTEEQIEQAGSITKEIARITSTFKSNGASRWDPIPPLRPTDSGWNRVRAIDGSNGNGNGTTGAEYHGVERRRGGDWNWTSSDNDTPSDVEFGAQRWAEQAASAESDEPALSRPWGLLSRFQQTNMITPARKNGSANGNGASSNGTGVVERERDLEADTVRPDRKG